MNNTPQYVVVKLLKERSEKKTLRKKKFLKGKQVNLKKKQVVRFKDDFSQKWWKWEGSEKVPLGAERVTSNLKFGAQQKSQNEKSDMFRQIRMENESTKRNSQVCQMEGS